jgi:hypothetical protein
MLRKRRFKAKLRRPQFINGYYEWLIYDQNGLYLGRYVADTEGFWASVDPLAARLLDIKL